MEPEQLTGRQGGALLLGTAAPLLLEASRADPPGWALGIGIALLLGMLLYNINRPEQGLFRLLKRTWGRRIGSILVVGYLLWTLMMLGRTFCRSAECFPNTTAWPWVPAVLGTLTWLALRRGSGSLARCAGVLWLPLGVIFLWLLLRASQAGTWEKQDLGGWWGWQSGAAALAPALLAAGTLPGDAESHRNLAWFALGLAVLVTAWAVVSRAVLGRGLQNELQRPFYELVRSVELFEGGAHLEALAAAAQETGFFIVLGLYGTFAMELAGSLGLKRERWAAAFLALGFLAGGILRTWDEKSLKIELALNVLFCALIPMGTQAIAVVRKPGKNQEKRRKKPEKIT